MTPWKATELLGLAVFLVFAIALFSDDPRGK